jgi:hypothetical protein
MMDLMSLEEQVDREFAAARRRARMRRLKGLFAWKGRTRHASIVRSDAAIGRGVRRGRSTVVASGVVGSVGKHDRFDEGFMAA